MFVIVLKHSFWKFQNKKGEKKGNDNSSVGRTKTECYTWTLFDSIQFTRLYSECNDSIVLNITIRYLCSFNTIKGYQHLDTAITATNHPPHRIYANLSMNRFNTNKMHANDTLVVVFQQTIAHKHIRCYSFIRLEGVWNVTFFILLFDWPQDGFSF